ncbi:MAG: carbohydrate kinase, partial [Phenylobacterium sp.]|nr:carbohydrate kinase [Phenylobacterium sp.]
RRLAPLRRAGEVLGPVAPEWVRRSGLPADCQVFCGLHDSNAALLGGRGHAEFAAGEATVLSTGTWFVAMRSAGPARGPARLELDEGRDCLVNADAEGRAVPSARFMGGREAEQILGGDPAGPATETALVERVPQLLARGVQIHPSFAPGVGPFPGHRGGWSREPADPDDRRAALGLYLALMADASLELIGSRRCLLVEGRFAASPVFVRALASLRPTQQVYVCDADDDVAYGALRLVQPDRPPPSPLIPVRPLAASLTAYRALWRAGLARQPA